MLFPSHSTEAQGSYLLLPEDAQQHYASNVEYLGGMLGIGRRQFLSFTVILVSVVLGLSVSIFCGFMHKCYYLKDYGSETRRRLWRALSVTWFIRDTRLLTRLRAEESRLILKKHPDVQAEKS